MVEWTNLQRGQTTVGGQEVLLLKWVGFGRDCIECRRCRGCLPREIMRMRPSQSDHLAHGESQGCCRADGGRLTSDRVLQLQIVLTVLDLALDSVASLRSAATSHS